MNIDDKVYGEDREKKTLNILKIAAVAVCAAVILALGILAWALPQKTYSEYEKRDLAQMPEFSLEALFGGTYTQDVEISYSDTFAFRDGFVKIAAFIDDLKGIRSTGKIYTGNSDPQPAPPSSSTESASEPESQSSEEKVSDTDLESSGSSSSEPEEEPDDGVEGETIGGIFIYKGVGYELLGGSEETENYYASVINKYREALPDNVRLYNMVVPKHCEFALPKKYRILTRSAYDCINHIYGQLEPGITAVDAYSALQEHKDEYIYFNTDHHWTGLGAYYGYTSLAKAAGIDYYDYDSYEKHVIEGFLGTLYTATMDSSLQKTGDYVEWCEFPVENRTYQYQKGDLANYYSTTVMASYAKGVNAYGVFLAGDFPLTVIKTDNPNGRKLAIIKESYGNALSTFVAAGFAETYIVDERYFEGNFLDLVSECGITDVLIVNNVSSANTNYHIANIESLLTQKYSGTVNYPKE